MGKNWSWPWRDPYGRGWGAGTGPAFRWVSLTTAADDRKIPLATPMRLLLYVVQIDLSFSEDLLWILSPETGSLLVS